jgi:hypothetical protein
MSRWVIGLMVGLFAGCPAQSPADAGFDAGFDQDDAGRCMTGCTLANGSCGAGDRLDACGANGAPCRACGAGQACGATGCETPPPTRAVGAACTADSECRAGLGPTAICRTMTSSGTAVYQGGYCTLRCPATACPTGSSCVSLDVSFGETEALCWDNCGSTDACRVPGYACYQVGGGNACWLNPSLARSPMRQPTRSATRAPTTRNAKVLRPSAGFACSATSAARGPTGIARSRSAPTTASARATVVRSAPSFPSAIRSWRGACAGVGSRKRLTVARPTVAKATAACATSRYWPMEASGPPTTAHVCLPRRWHRRARGSRVRRWVTA